MLYQFEPEEPVEAVGLNKDVECILNENAFRGFADWRVIPSGVAIRESDGEKLDWMSPDQATREALKILIASKPATLAWSSEKPKVVGWYFLKNEPDKVSTNLWHIDEEDLEHQTWVDTVQFAGPILEPKERES